MSEPTELALVVKAIKSGLGGCVEWDIHEVDRIEAELLRHGLVLHAVRKALIDHIRKSGEVLQVKEVREHWKDRRDYWYKTFVPMLQFPKGLFVEIALDNMDSELPEIRILNAHEQH